MSFINLSIDPDRIATALERISLALDRAFPEPIPVTAQELPTYTGPSPLPPMVSTVAESPEEYQSRISSESSLAASLGVAPWSPDFQSAITEMRDHLMRSRMEMNDEGILVTTEGCTEAEADDLVRKCFREARAAQNERKEEVRS